MMIIGLMNDYGICSKFTTKPRLHTGLFTSSGHTIRAFSLQVCSFGI